MKSDIFNHYKNKVCKMFRISPEELFSKTKRQDIVDARHMLYFLCKERPMQITYIKKYMSDNGYNIAHSSIIHGINSVTKKMSEDADYVSIIRELKKF